jgi:hypothetical protein
MLNGPRGTMGGENFVVATRAGAAAPPKPRAGPPAKKKYAFPVANEICTDFALGVSVSAAGKQCERARALQL